MPTVVKREMAAKRKSTHLMMRSSRYLPPPLAIRGLPAGAVVRAAGFAPSIRSKSNAVHCWGVVVGGVIGPAAADDWGAAVILGRRLRG